MKSPSFVTEAASWFGLGSVIATDAVTEGFSHSVFQLETTAGIFALKRINTELTVGGRPESIRAAARIETAAIERGIPAPAPVLDSTGEAIVELDGGDWVRVHEWAHGCTRQSEKASNEEIDQAVTVLAQLHALSLPAHAELDIEVPLNWTAMAAGSVAARVAWATDLSALVPALETAAAWAHQRPDLPRLSSHRDIYPRNVSFSERHIQLLDWDLAGSTSIDEELAVAAVEWSGGIVTQADLLSVTEFVHKYRQSTGHRISAERSLFSRWLTRQLRWLEYHIRISIEDSDELATKRVGFLLPRIERQLLELDDWLLALDA